MFIIYYILFTILCIYETILYIYILYLILRVGSIGIVWTPWLIVVTNCFLLVGVTMSMGQRP